MTDVDVRIASTWHAAYMRGCESLFQFDGRLPVPTGLIIGEAPGPNTDGNVPLYPHNQGSAASLLMKYGGLDEKTWLGKTYKVNLCKDEWSSKEARAMAEGIRFWLRTTRGEYRKAPRRVLLLGRRVVGAWGGLRQIPFGSTEIVDKNFDDLLEVVWIPHPSGRNLLYNDPASRERAGKAVKWVMYEKSTFPF